MQHDARKIVNGKSKILISVVMFFVMVNSASAAPSVDSVSGAVTHDSVVTVDGSGFGVKSPVAPLKWDPVDGMYANLFNGDRIPVGISHPWPEGYGGISPRYKTVNPRGKWTAKYSNNAGSNNGSSTEQAAVGGIEFPQVGNGIMYVTWWNWIGTNGDLDNSQNKFTRFTPTGSWEIASVIWSPDHSHGYDFSAGYRFSGWHDPNVDRGAWNRMQKIIDNSFMPHHPRVLLDTNNQNFFDCYPGKSEECMSGGAVSGDLPSIDGIGAIGWMPEFDFSSDCATVDFGEIYVDNTRARVEICNASTKDASNHCEIQIPQTSWNDEQLQIKVNQGSFADNSIQYLYVLDANGTPNSTGKQIIFGSGTSDTTPPSSATNLAVL